MNVDDDLRYQAVLLRRCVQRLARRLQAERAAEGLSLTKISVLGHLARRGDLTPSQLAAADRLRPQSLTRVLAELRDDGLVALVSGGAQAEPVFGGAEHPPRLPGGAQAEPVFGGAEHPPRLPGGGDRRQRRLRVTEAGRTALALDMAQRDEWLAGAMVELLSPTERELLTLSAPLLERLADRDR
jgi:DNA-binding MarR family transcriptional regulator